MADKYKYNPLTGKMDIVGDGSGTDDILADWEATTTTPKLPTGVKVKDKTAMEILKMMLCPDLAPSCSIVSDISANNYTHEEGTELKPTFTIKPVKATYDLSNMTLYCTNNLGQTTAIKNWNSITGETIEYKPEDLSIMSYAKVWVEVTDSKGLKGNSNTLIYQFGNKKYIGFGPDVAIEDINLNFLEALELHNIVSTSKTTALATYHQRTVGGVKLNEYIYVAMPAAWNLTATEIKDAEKDSGFMHEYGEVTIVKGTAQVKYKVFVSNKKQAGDVRIQIM